MITSVKAVVEDLVGSLVPFAQPITIPEGETGTINVASVHADASIYVLGVGVQVQFSVRSGSNLIISRQLTIDNINAGFGHVPLVVADTIGMAPAEYIYDMWLTDVAGNRYQVIPPSFFIVAPSETQLNQPITVPASQQPLALGPPGPAGLFTITSIKTAIYSAHINELVRVDPTGGSFAITLPTAVGNAGFSIAVKNIGVSANNVAINTSGGQTIDGSGFYLLTGPHSDAIFVSDGVNWVVL